jgi:hypothetical protein
LSAIQRRPLVWFFALAYAFCWIQAASAALGLINQVPSVLLHFVGGLGPIVSANRVARDTIDPGMRTFGRYWDVALVRALSGRSGSASEPTDEAAR